MKILTILMVVLYLGLMAGAIAFCYESWKEYWEGITTFSVDTEPITPLDIPTMTFCYEYADLEAIPGRVTDTFPSL